jgi:hypothetical protein
MTNEELVYLIIGRLTYQLEAARLENAELRTRLPQPLTEPVEKSRGG